MTGTLAEFQQLVNAEDYLEFFGLPYDPTFVNVNRLHILQKFSTLIKAIDAEFPDLNDTEKLERYQAALQQAYNTFTTSSPLTEKLFKVFNEKPPNLVLLSEIGTD
ncbi:nitrogenase-stabilizing/protective protein NifW [Leptolyngbya sp. NK1-12]|uniref:Nitrogenase-stabilizing/protective protein NifW n=1 Tax=Leptolyngbya sp. NK1-12 TaxID=2547451 RepID=A0AA96WKU4_9CYAN|nr:nitrogenase-stabilizing/protective protein NifW [Leptolyngbya sp. NK1-12]WNZ26935.1 nitrogenase-stabilizing/protective protein NifW [Leptolyngbya sp. NK1-12]